MYSHLERRSALALSTSLLGVLAALPACPASASSISGALRGSAQIHPSSTTPSYTLEGNLSGEQLKELLSKLPVKTGPLSPAQLATVLSHLPPLQALAIPHLEEALKQSLESSGAGAMLEEALKNPSSLASTVLQSVKGLLSLSELLKLELLLGKPPAQALQEALEKVDAGELLHELLGTGTEGPGKALEALLKALPASTLEAPLGSGLATEPVTEQTVEELAGDLGTNATDLAHSADETTSELPASAKALTTPLADGKVLSVLDGADKAVMGTLGTLTPEGGSGEGKGSGSGSGGSGDSGGSGSGSSSGGSGASGGGSGGSGGPGAPGGAGVVVEIPSSSSTQAGTASGKGGRVALISHSVHDGIATLVFSVPSAGALTLRNGDIRPITRRVGHAGRVRIQARLSRAGKTALRGHHHRLQLRLNVSFTPSHGARSSLSAALLFK
ncbi:MAG TPA: hypothetical protein VGP17_12010 [Solirubrobacteraceae bacterium]|jgi:hypothetical protein|nr:hypothetical protein [Solirubrobacteraceae bacterium]